MKNNNLGIINLNTDNKKIIKEKVVNNYWPFSFAKITMSENDFSKIDKMVEEKVEKILESISTYEMGDLIENKDVVEESLKAVVDTVLKEGTTNKSYSITAEYIESAPSLEGFEVFDKIDLINKIKYWDDELFNEFISMMNSMVKMQNHILIKYGESKISWAQNFLQYDENTQKLLMKFASIGILSIGVRVHGGIGEYPETNGTCQNFQHTRVFEALISIFNKFQIQKSEQQSPQ